MPLAAILFRAIFVLLISAGVCGRQCSDNCITDGNQVHRSVSACPDQHAVAASSCAQGRRLLLQERRTLQQGETQEHDQVSVESRRSQQWEKQDHDQSSDEYADESTDESTENSAYPQFVTDSVGWITGKSDNKSMAISKAWKLGDHVQLIGLKKDDFNGLTGRIVDQPDPGTWRVALDWTSTRYDVDAEHLSVEVLKPGVKVQLEHLKQARYNGKTGRVLSLDPWSNRWLINLDGKEKGKEKNISVKFSNINTKVLLQEYRDAEKQKKEAREEHRKEINKLLKKARAARDKRNGVEKIKKERSLMGLHPCQVACIIILVCIFTFWFNKLYKDAWYHTWGCNVGFW